jgi:hypothetical protein
VKLILLEATVLLATVLAWRHFTKPPVYDFPAHEWAGEEHKH